MWNNPDFKFPNPEHLLWICPLCFALGVLVTAVLFRLLG